MMPWSAQWNGVTEHNGRSDGTGASEHCSIDSETFAPRRRASNEEQKRGAKRQRLDPEIGLFKLNEIDANYKSNNTRVPDLSAEIRIVFSSTEVYIGKYVGHGQSKTVFVIRSSSRKEASMAPY